MVNIWLEYVKSKRGQKKTTSVLAHEWKNMNATLVTVHVEYIQNMTNQLNELREQLNQLKVYVQVLETELDMRMQDMRMQDKRMQISECKIIY